MLIKERCLDDFRGMHRGEPMMMATATSAGILRPLPSLITPSHMAVTARHATSGEHDAPYGMDNQRTPAQRVWQALKHV